MLKASSGNVLVDNASRRPDNVEFTCWFDSAGWRPTEAQQTRMDPSKTRTEAPRGTQLRAVPFRIS